MNSISPAAQHPDLNANSHRADEFPRARAILLLTFLIIAGAVVRLLGTRNDLWLDEILSLQTARSITSPWQIFTATHDDNNHYLNTLYLYFVSRATYEPLFRYFSVACGIALLPAGYWLGAQRGKRAGLIFAALLTCSYPLIHFSSEARGYSGALLGSLLGVAALNSWLKRRSWLTTLIYGVSFSFAILSHLTACLIWIPIVCASSLILAARKPRMRSLLLWMILNLLPCVVLTTLYFVDLRDLLQRGGPIMTLPRGMARLLALSLGWPANDTASVLVLLIPLLLLAAWQLRILQKRRDSLWLLLTFIFITPSACMLFIQPAFFSPRYFLVIIPFVYLLIAFLIDRLAETKIGRLFAAILVALFIVGEGSLYLNFLKVGRGQFIAGLRYIAANTPGPFLNVASSQDFRATIELRYFGPKVSATRPFSYIKKDDQGFFTPDWYILHSEGYDPMGPAILTFPDQPPWYRVAYFPALELSGQAWTLYNHLPPNDPPSGLTSH